MRPYVLALAVVVLLSACSGDRDKSAGGTGRVRDAAVGRADPADRVGTVGVPAAAPAAAHVALPQWFPRDVYLPADHAVVEVNEGRGAHAVELRTPGEVLSLAPQAQAAMLAAGWAEHHYSPVDTRGGASMYYRKGNRSATLAMAWGGPSHVRVMYNFAEVGGSKPD